VEPARLLRDMVEIESLSGAESALAAYLVDAMRDLGYDDAHVDATGNAVGIREGRSTGDAPREIVLLGHMDTVPGNVPVRQEGDLLYGRGTVDAKGPLATFVLAVAGLTPAPGTRLVVVGAVEEEAPSSRGAHAIAAGRAAPEACLIGEPSGWDALTLGYKGRLLARYELTQPGGHSAGPETAVAEHAVAFWNAVAAHCAAHNADRPRLFDQLLPALEAIRTDVDGLRERVTATVGFRLPPDIGPDALAATLRELAGEATVDFAGNAPAWSSPRTSPLARGFQRAARGRDHKLRYKHKTGTSDMNVLGPVWGCPIAAYGPGDSQLDHTPNEHVSIAEYERAIDLLARALVEMGFGVAR